MMLNLEKFKRFLIDSNLVSTKNLELAEAEEFQTGRKLEDVLVRRNLVSEEMIAKTRAYVLGVPFIDLTNEVILPEVLKIIPEPIARHYNIVPFKRSGNNLEVAVLNLDDLNILESIKNKSNLNILPRLTSKNSLESVIGQYQNKMDEEFSRVVKDESLMVDLVDTIIRHATLKDVSDINIEPREKDVVISYRKNGVLKNIITLSKDTHRNITDHIKVLAGLKLDQDNLPQDGRFKMETDNYKTFFRVSVLPSNNGEKTVIRILHKNSQGFTLESLGLQGEVLEVVHKAINSHNGLVLVTGPAGSGKTTTLYTFLDILNRPPVNISTIENPIEYRIPRINQVEIGSSAHPSFAQCLKSTISRDPEVVMVSEIPDTETTALAVNTSLANHLVLSSLRANSVVEVVEHLVNTKIEPFLISSAVTTIIAQKLVRKLCPDSREKYNLRKSEIEALSKRINLEKILSVLKREKIVSEKDTWKTINFYRRTESPNCPTGFKGKIGIFEVLNVTPKIKKMIVALAFSDEIKKQAEVDGMVTILEDGFIKAVQGITSIEEVLKVLCL